MASFTDKQQTIWDIQLDAPTIIKVREECDPRFMLGDDNEDDNTCLRLGDDPVLLCLVLYVLCGRQCSERKIEQLQFMHDVIGDGDTIQAAGEALVAAIVNFTPPRKRKWMEAVIKKQRAMEDLAVAKALHKMDDPALMARLDKSIEEQMDEALNRLMPPENPTDSPDSSESTPPA